MANFKLAVPVLLVCCISNAAPLDNAKGFIEGLYLGYKGTQVNSVGCLDLDAQLSILKHYNELKAHVSANSHLEEALSSAVKILGDLNKVGLACGLSDIYSDFSESLSEHGAKKLLNTLMLEWSYFSRAKDEIKNELKEGHFYRAGEYFGKAVKLLSSPSCVEDSLINQLTKTSELTDSDTCYFDSLKILEKTYTFKKHVKSCAEFNIMSCESIFWDLKDLIVQLEELISDCLSRSSYQSFRDLLAKENPLLEGLLLTESFLKSF